MDKLPIFNKRHEIVTEVTNKWLDDYNRIDLVECVTEPDRFIMLPMHQMINLLKNAFVKTDDKTALAALQMRFSKEIQEANNIGHLQSIMDECSEYIDFQIQCESILTAYNHAKKAEDKTL
jgi:urate oxidase